jgi:hypothetical protein
VVDAAPTTDAEASGKPPRGVNTRAKTERVMVCAHCRVPAQQLWHRISISKSAYLNDDPDDLRDMGGLMPASIE